MAKGKSKTYRTIGVVIIAIPMLLYGLSSFDRTASEEVGLKVGDHSLHVEIVGDEITRNISLYSSIYGFDPNNPPDEMRELVEDQVYSGFIRQLLMANLASDADLEPTDEDVVEEIRGTQAFYVDGRFSPQRFNSLVGEPSAYVRRLRLRLSGDKVADAFISAEIAVPEFLDILGRFQGEQRVVRKLEIPLDYSSTSASVTEAEIEEYYEGNKASFIQPERLQIEYVQVSGDDVKDRVTVDEEKLRAAHEARQVATETSEERQLSLIVLDSEDDAEAALVELQGGAEFEAVALERSIDEGSKEVGGDIGFLTREDLDEDIAEEVFAADVNEVLGPYKVDGEWLLFKVTGTIGGSKSDFEQVRDDLVAQVRQEQEEIELNLLATELEDLALEYDDDLESVAQQLGLDMQTTDWISKEDTVAQVPPPFNEEYLLSDAFSEELTESGNNSNLLGKRDGTYLVMRVAQHEVERQLEMAEVKEEISQTIGRNKTLFALRDDLRGKIRKLLVGEDEPSLDFDAQEQLAIDIFASPGRLAELGITPEEQLGLFSGNLAPSQTGLPAYYINYDEEKESVAIFRIDEINPGAEPNDAARELLASNIGFAEANIMLSGFLDEAGRGIDVSVNEEAIDIQLRGGS